MHILLTHPSATPPGSIADRVLVKNAVIYDTVPRTLPNPKKKFDFLSHEKIEFPLYLSSKLLIPGRNISCWT